MPPATSGTSAAPDRATITARLLETVRDRTGYPIETLGLDLDMEADLGSTRSSGSRSWESCAMNSRA